MAYYDDIRKVHEAMARMRRLESDNERIVMVSDPDRFRGGREYVRPEVHENAKPYARPPKPSRAGNGDDGRQS